jgi:hypothetical protein
LSGDLEHGRQIIDEIERYNPNVPGWLRAVAFFYHLAKGAYDQALHEARRFRMPDEHPWDPILRATATGQLGEKKVAGAAYRELVKKFPDVARNVDDAIRMYFHFDHWVEAVLEGLRKARSAAR